MTEREKVIAGFEDSLANNGCGFMDGIGELFAVSGEDLQNAIALLKAQEPRVMTSTEVGTWVMIDRVDRAPIVVEVRNRFMAWVVGDEYYDLPDSNLSLELYGKRWRCWTSRPDDKRRAETPWE